MDSAPEIARHWSFSLRALCGCTSLSEYVHNGFKVGPNYKEPPAPVAKNWIDIDDKRVSSESDDHTHWWKNFNDPGLDDLIATRIAKT